MNDWRIRSRRHLVRYPSDAEIVAMIRWATQHGKIWSKQDLIDRLGVSVERPLRRLLHAKFLKVTRGTSQKYVRREKPTQKPKLRGGKKAAEVDIEAIERGFAEGRSGREIAGLLGISDAILRRKLKQEGFEFVANEGYLLDQKSEHPRAYHLPIG